jgi:hypothetical protein
MTQYLHRQCRTNSTNAHERIHSVVGVKPDGGPGESVPEMRKVMSTTQTTGLAATVVSSPAEILELTPFVRSLVEEPGMLGPRFFLASFLPQYWKPRVVVVSRGPRTVGLLYCKERVVAGIATGIVFGDDTLGAMIAARTGETDSVLHCAVEALLKHVVALRFRLGSDRLALMESAKAGACIYFRRAKHHAHLELPGNYGEFLARVGPCTRNNLRRYRRRSEAAGNEFSPDLEFIEFCAAARGLFPNASFATSNRELERALDMISAMPMPSRLLIGLRQANGKWISLAGGWYDGERAILNMQLNDRRMGRDSLSLVLRSYLIEMLVKRGFREIIFWAGTSAPLNSYLAQREEFVAYVDAQSQAWRLVRMACATLAKLAPFSLGDWLEWVAPNVGLGGSKPLALKPTS